MAVFSRTFDIKGEFSLLEHVVHLLGQHKDTDYYVYERDSSWFVGLGSHASLITDSRGENATICSGHSQQSFPIVDSITQVSRQFVSDYSRPACKVYGQAGYNYGLHLRKKSFMPGEWPMLSLMVPRNEVVFTGSQVTIRGESADVTESLYDNIMLSEPISPSPSFMAVDTSQNGEHYKSLVLDAIADIAAGKFPKVVACRSISLPQPVDMLATLFQGRLHNTPERTFALSQAGISAVGFSPELSCSTENGLVITQAVAGTASRLGSPEEIEIRRKALLADNKEVAEHMVAVLNGVKSLQSNNLCDPKTVCARDMLTVIPRGPVQHLSTTVEGVLAPGKDCWDVLEALFPDLNASGLPATEDDARFGMKPWELYFGAVLLIEGTEFLEAALVLRTVFQDEKRTWIQAGAGIMKESCPEREFLETREKLSSIVPFLVAEGIKV